MNPKIQKDAASAPTISTGIFKGMKLSTPPGEGTRPTSSKTRAAALNSLQTRLADARFCDLFAGSGAIGVEAVSRGAASCTFLESAPQALNALNRNLLECERRSLAQGLPPPSFRVVPGDVRRFLSDARQRRHEDVNGGNDRKFDIIWADPPYALVSEILPDLLAFADDTLEPGGILMLESGAAVPVESTGSDVATGMRRKSEKKYGGTYLTTWEKEA